VLQVPSTQIPKLHVDLNQFVGHAKHHGMLVQKFVRWSIHGIQSNNSC